MMHAVVPLVQLQPFAHGRRRGRRPFGFDLAPHTFVVLDPGNPLAASSGAALVCFESDVIHPRVEKVADGKDEPMSAVTRAKLGARLGRSFTRGPFNRQIVQALNLQPQVDGRIVMWLGPGGRGRNLFYEEQTPKVKHSKLWEDTFNRADGALNGSTLSGGGAAWSASGWATSGNAARNTAMASDTFDPARVDTDGDTDSLYARATLSTFTPGDTAAVLIAAVGTNQASDGSSGYGFQQVYEAASEYRQLFSFDEVTLDEDVSTAVATGVMLIRRSGSSLEALLGGVSVLGPVTVNTQASGVGNRRVGFSSYYFGSAGTPTVIFEDFIGGDLVAAARRQRLLITQAVPRAAYY